MNLDPTEGEPRRAEDLTRSGGAGGGEARGSDWPRWTLFAFSAVLSGLALWTGWAWLTLFALGALLAGITINAWSTRRVQPRRASGTRASGLTLHARRADIALLAVKSRLADPIYTGSPRGPAGARRARWTRWANESLGSPRRARGADDAVDDSPGEGEGR